MTLLILGGTQFVGRHLVDAALRQGHQVTLFNRGRTNPGLFPEAEEIHGDRDGGLDVLAGRQWDVVVDTCGYVPRVVSQSARGLASAAAAYVFISSLSVYADYVHPITGEDDPLAALEDPTVEDITGQTYGGLKALCEGAVTEHFGGPVVHIRPGFIVGPWDPTDRFTYWPRRVRAGGTMLVPGTRGVPVQMVDVRDLADFTLRVATRGDRDVYNVAGPASPLTWCEMLDTCNSVCEADTALCWVGDDFVAEQKFEGTELPLWPDPTFRGVMQANCERAITAGLTFRPLADTIRDTLAWHDAHGVPNTGLSAEHEQDLLRRWRESRASM